MQKVIRVLAINFSIFLILLLSPPFFLKIYTFFKSRFVELSNSSWDRRAFYPTYSDKNFSVKLFNELEFYKTEYRSFVGWRGKKINFQYTNIGGPYGSRKSIGEEINGSVWFFGGSTMWGTGASDSQTIPSHFNAITRMPVYNFAQSSWSSRQSLNQLMNTLGDKHKPSVIIFYDGVVEVAAQCRSEIKSIPSYSHEQYLSQRLEPTSTILGKSLLNFVYEPYKVFINKFTSISSNELSTYDCDTNKQKAYAVAQHLIENWRNAFLIANDNKASFYGILQPTLFTTDTNFNYLGNRDKREISLLENQYKIVYPLIMEEFKKECLKDKDFCSSLIDGTNWLDGQKNIFIDFCHVNSHGNNIISKRIAELLNK